MNAFGLLLLLFAASAQCLCDSGADRCACKDCWCGWSYDDAWRLAVQSHQPLLVFVRQKPSRVPGCISCRRDAYPGQPVPGVIIGLPDGAGGVEEAGRRDGTATTAWLAQRVRELQAARAARLLACRPAARTRASPCISGG